MMSIPEMMMRFISRSGATTSPAIMLTAIYGPGLVTSIVAIRFAKGSARERALEHLRARGADAVPLGKDAIVSHLGARRAVGSEAAAAVMNRVDLYIRFSMGMGARAGTVRSRKRYEGASVNIPGCRRAVVAAGLVAAVHKG